MDGALPQRHRTHEIEELSDRFFRSCVPQNWIATKINPDYGIDYNCEIVFDTDVSGINFSVQLKGKEEDKNKDYITIKSIKRTTINRWLNRLEPTMIVAFIVKENKAYWMWFENNTVNLTLNNKTFSIKIPRTNKLNEVNWLDISDHVSKIFSRRNLLYELPDIKSNNSEAWDLFLAHKFELALPLLKSLKGYEKDSLILNAVAVCNFQLFQYQNALIAINKALEIHNDVYLELNKAAILTEQGISLNDKRKIELSIALYKKIIDSGFKHESVFYNYGSALAKINKYDESIAQFKISLSFNPNNFSSWNNLGNSYMCLDKFQLALDCFNKALKIAPNLPETLYSKGSTLHKYFGQTDEGLKLMLKATKLSDRFEKDGPFSYYWISDAYLKKHDYDNAKQWNSKGLAFFPTSEYLLDQRKKLQ